MDKLKQFWRSRSNRWQVFGYRTALRNWPSTADFPVTHPVPLVGDLTQGELAVNVTDKKL